MEEQRIQLMPQRNGEHLQPILPVYTTALQENPTDEWDLRQLLTIARRRAVVIGSVAVAISATVWFWTLTREPRYEGKFRLLVEPVTTENKSKLEGLAQTPAGVNPIQQESLDYDSQIEVLRSPELMAPLIKKLAAHYPDINYDSLIENLTINRFQETKILEFRYQDPDPQKIQFVLQQLSQEFLKYSLQERQTNLRQGIQFVDAQMPELRSRVNNLQKDLQQFRQQYEFVNPEVKAEQLAQQVNTIKFQKLDTQKQLAEARNFYAILQSPSGVKLAETGALSAALPGSSSARLAETNASNATPETNAANGTLPERSSAPEALNGSSIYENLVSQLRDVESQIAADLTRFQENSPSIQALRQKRENLLPVLRQEANRVLENKLVEVRNQISALQTQESKIAQAESSLNQQTKQLPVLARQYADLQRELKVATESLNRFLEKRESLQIETAQKEIPWQMIAAPQLAQQPISPNIPRNLILGAIAGILAGLGAALLAERLDNVFHSPEDLKEVTKLPVLGVIPFRKQLKQLEPTTQEVGEVEPNTNDRNLVLRKLNRSQGESYSYFPFVEAFRSLYTNISFLGSDTPMHSLVISSALHAEGKSTVSLNLAQAAAAMGRRVLLVDADLRLPKVHTQLGLPNEQGLSNVISANLAVSEAIQRSPEWDNLSVLTSGPIPPDPTKLLSSRKMQSIMEQLRREFDLVIYDTPPVLGLADGNLLATHTAGIILVVRIGKTDRSVLTQTLDQLKISRAAVLGMVINGVENYDRSSGYGYYYYRHQPTGVSWLTFFCLICFHPDTLSLADWGINLLKTKYSTTAAIIPLIGLMPGEK